MNPIFRQNVRTTILFTHLGNNWIRGSERCLLDLLKNIDTSRYNPVVWCNADKMVDEVKQLNIPVYQSRFTLLLGWESPKYDFQNYKTMIKFGKMLVKRYQVKLLHANNGAPSQWLTEISRQMKIPLVTHLHARFVFRDRITLKLHTSNKTIGVSQSVINPLIEDGVSLKQLTVISNGIDAQRLLQQPSINLRSRIGASESDVVIASVGSLIERKGMDLVIEAVKMNLQDSTSIKLIILGEGVERPQLEKLIKRHQLESHVFLLGERDDAFGILRGTANLFVSGAREEAFGLVLAEAGLAKLPTIAPRVGGIPSVILDQKTGVLVEPGNPLFLAAAIRKFMASEKIYIQMGQDAYSHVLDKFTIEQNVNAIQNVYDEVLNSSKENSDWLKSKTIKICFLTIKHLLKLAHKKLLTDIRVHTT